MNEHNFIFITQNDPFYVRIFFEEFLSKYPDLQDLRGVVIAPAMGKKSLSRLIKQMYDFYGPVDFVRVGIKYVWYKLAARLPTFMRRSRFYSIEQICAHYKIEAIHASDINNAEFLQKLKDQNLDLIISVAAPQVFRKELINIPRRGCINIHNSKLPKYRGMLPNFWQMFHGEKFVGTTIHRINAGIDDGDILLQAESPITEGESLDSLIQRTKRSGAHLMMEMLKQFHAGEPEPIPNRSEEATYFTFPTREQVRAFRRRGYRLI